MRRLLGWLCIATLAVSLVSCSRNKKSTEKAKASASATQVASAKAPGTEKPKRVPKPNALPAPADLKTPPSDAEKTASGLVSKVLQKGEGTDHPKPTDTVKVHYSGWEQSDGYMFDSSVARGNPISFELGRVIPGWREGLQLMVEGEKRRLWIPAKLAYGDKPRGNAPSGPLTFDVELLQILKPPPVPEDVAAPPATAKKTKSGIAYRVLQKGTGKAHPSAESRVTVHYSGWTTDGKMFDSSVTRGQPSTFALNHVIPGWTEGVQLMVEGEKTRFWIPGKLAYGEKKEGAPPTGRPMGMLVFDIELVKVQESPGAGSATATKAAGTSKATGTTKAAGTTKAK